MTRVAERLSVGFVWTSLCASQTINGFANVPIMIGTDTPAKLRLIIHFDTAAKSSSVSSRLKLGAHPVDRFVDTALSRIANHTAPTGAQSARRAAPRFRCFS